MGRRRRPHCSSVALPASALAVVPGPYARHPFPAFDQGEEAKELVGPPFGTNMAFRKAVFAKYGGFRTDLGPSPGNEIRAEDTEFGRRLIAAGERLRYEPSAIVYHPVPESRIDKKFFLKWWFDYGQANAREFPVQPLHLFCNLTAWTLRWMVAFEPRLRFHCKLVVWERTGSIVEFFRQVLEAKKRSFSNAKALGNKAEPLNLRVGEWVEVRTPEEILATLDKRGRLDGLPFMPEMLDFCGRRFRIFKRSDKTCQYTAGWSIRRMKNSVFLEAVRCDGAGHDGCQAGCLIFWKEAWLKRLESDVVPVEIVRRLGLVSARPMGLCALEDVWTASQTITTAGEKIYSCQETDVLKYSSPMKTWDPRQYVRDLRSGNLASGLADDSRAQRALDMMLSILRVLSAITIRLL